LIKPAIETGLVGGDHKLAVDPTDGLLFRNHQSREVFGKMAAGRFSVKDITEDRQRFLHDRRKVHNGWHRGSLHTALRALRVQRGVLHYTPSILLCKSSVQSLSWQYILSSP